MKSIILITASKILMPILLIFSIFLLLRGHNEPGGGFVGGLVAASGYALLTLAYGVKYTRKILGVSPNFIMGIGLLFSLGSGFISLFYYEPFMTGKWTEFSVPIIGKLGTPFLFDIGVYLVVFSIVINIIFTLEEDEKITMGDE